MYRGASRREDHLNCFTCSKRGHGYQRVSTRILRASILIDWVLLRLLFTLFLFIVSIPLVPWQFLFHGIRFCFPALCIYNFFSCFVIEADASTRAVAAVLSQRNKHTGQLHPIDFFSSALSSAQRNYSAGQLEAWALVAACRKWRTYLGARGEVELITDHCPLKWLRSQKDPRRTYARWILELEEYSYNIIHRPGRENNLPDYLSRIPTIEIDAEVQNECTFEDKIFTVVSQHEEEPKLNLAQLSQEQNLLVFM